MGSAADVREIDRCVEEFVALRTSQSPTSKTVGCLSTAFGGSGSKSPILTKGHTRMAYDRNGRAPSV
jgi:hypothetical protein